MPFKQDKGFTLIELMIVVAIIGILAAIAIPQFASLIAKSQEGAAKGSLGAIRSSLSIYYGDMEGVYPQDSTLASLTTNSKYLAKIPNVSLPNNKTYNVGHAQTNAVTNTFADYGSSSLWYYNNATTGGWGTILVNCTHSDVKSSSWSAY